MNKKENDKKRNIDENLEFLNEVEPVVIATWILRSLGIYTLGKKFLMDIFNKYHKMCNNLSGKEYKICYYRAKLMTLRQELTVLSKAVSKCDQQKNPDKCKLTIQKSMENIKEKMNKINAQMRVYRGI